MKRIYIFLVLLIIMIAVMSQTGKLLSSAKSSPKGIVSLELAFTDNIAGSIARDWDSVYVLRGKFCGFPGSRTEAGKDGKVKLLSLAFINTYWDMIFILVYGLLLWSVNMHANKDDNKKKKTVTILIIIACLLDYLENFGMLSFLKTQSYPALAFSIPAAIKFALILVVILWGLRGGKWLLHVLSIITGILGDISYVFRYSPLTIISILVLFFTVWGSDQGQDLLLTIGDDLWGPATLYFGISMLAVMNWYFPKFFMSDIDWTNKKLKTLFTEPFDYSNDLREEEPSQITIPRLMGVLTFLIPAFGMLKVLTLFGIWHDNTLPWPLLLLVLTTIFMQWCFRKRYFIAFYEKTPRLHNFTCILLFISPLILFAFHCGSPEDIRLLFWGLLFYSFLLALVTTNRTSMMQKIKLLNSKSITPLVWSSILIPVALFLYYFISNIFLCTGIPVTFLTLAVVMSGIITYYALFTILNVAGKKYKANLSLFVIVGLMLTAANCSNHFHYVDVKEAVNRPLSLDQYIKKWLDDRYNAAANDSPYQVYIVNSYGGGVRAAAWTCLSMAKLDSLQFAKTGHSFQDHVLSYSGASGGTIGASVLCANRYASDKPVASKQYYTFYNNDFLTPVLTGVIGNDIWYACLGFTKAKDRSKVQEHLWEQYFNAEFTSGSDTSFYSLPVNRIWDGTNTRVPLLFSNTTDLKQGRKGVMAPVRLRMSDFRGSILVQHLLGHDHTLKLSTAAFLSARFPYISPAGGFNTRHHFLDGGMVENSGAETSMQVYQVLKRFIEKPENSKYKHRFKVNVISLNSVYHTDSVALEERRNLSQLMAPVTGILSVGLSGNTKKADYTNRDYFTGRNRADSLAGKYYKIEPIKEKISPSINKACCSADSVLVPLPLGWSISKIALRRMAESLDQLCAPGGQLYDIVNKH